jgi:hypothetical protein
MPLIPSARVNWNNFNMNMLISVHCKKNIQGSAASLLPTAKTELVCDSMNSFDNFLKYGNLISHYTIVTHF